MISKAGHYEFIVREGYPFFLPLVVFAGVLWWYEYNWISMLFLILGFGVAYFFRNPERQSPQGEDIVLSPADGKVVQIVEDVTSRHISDFPLVRISIFMSIFDVHVNRWPISGLVKKITHVPGAFLDARESAASIANEHNSIVVQGANATIEVVQIAGKIARRIVCWVKEGDKAFQGQRFGLIKFGSRLDIYLPSSFSPTVAVGARVVAGVTVIAKQEAAPHS